MIKDAVKKILPNFLVDFYHFFLPLTGAFFYRFPSKNLKVIGVTGTNGKSTVVYMIEKIFEEAGLETASLSSIKFKIKEKEWINPLKMTMPGRFKIQKFLRQAVDADCKYAVLEVTSEGIKQHRHRFIDFDTAVFTNLSKEHIERHGSFEKYREAKGRLFKACKNIHIINADDPNAEYFLNFPAVKKITYGVRGGQPLIDRQPVSINLKLPGEFNIYNALAAISAGLSQGIDLEVCKKAVEGIESVPGRMEAVVKEPFRVIVDYAHTPAALEKVYQTIGGRKICVLGSAGGGRDKWKRPELGKIAAKYCDEIILTNEDPYDEAPEKILDDVAAGAPSALKILDRKEAIGKAISLVKASDTVIITGKGSEPWMCLERGKKVPWSDKEIALDILSKRDSLF